MNRLSARSDRSVSPYPKVPTNSVENVYTPISSLTRHWDARSPGAQLILSPGWIIPGGAAYARTNLLSASGWFRVSGKTNVSLKFTDLYSRRNVLGTLATPRIGSLAVRCQEVGETPSWIYGVRPHWSPTGTVGFHNLNPNKTYDIEFETNTPTDAVGCTSYWMISHQPGDTGVPALAEIGQLWQLEGIYSSSGGAFETIVDSRTPLIVVWLSDSNSGGWMGPDVADDTNWIDIYAAVGIFITGSFLSDLNYWDTGGARLQWHRIILEDWCSRNNRRLVLLNRSQGGSWQGAMHTDLRNYWTNATRRPELFENLRDVIGYRTDHSNSDFTIGSDWTGGLDTEVNLVGIGSIANDIIQAGNGILTGLESGFLTGMQDRFASSSASSTIKNSRAKFTNAKHLIFQSQFVGSIADDVRTYVRAGIGLPSYTAGYYGSQVSQPDYSWLGYIDLADYAVAAGWNQTITNFARIHPTRAEHAAMAPLIQTAFDSFMAR